MLTLTAAAVRLLDQGLFRVGSARYARDNHTFGLTTLTRAQASVDGEALAFDFVGKEHIAHHMIVRDAAVAEVIRRRLQRDDGDETALFSTAELPSPRRIDSVTVNSYIHTHSGAASSAKTFRTWGATVAAAAVAGGARFEGAGTRIRDELAPYHAAAHLLGDTLAVARQSYVHPQAISVGSTGPVRDAVSAASTEAGSDAVEAILRAEVLRKAVYEGLLSAEP
jgi:DNA topoisomerase-1